MLKPEPRETYAHHVLEDHSDAVVIEDGAARGIVKRQQMGPTLPGEGLGNVGSFAVVQVAKRSQVGAVKLRSWSARLDKVRL